jgi:AraC-like DNA-binding protein
LHRLKVIRRAEFGAGGRVHIDSAKGISAHRARAHRQAGRMSADLRASAMAPGYGVIVEARRLEQLEQGSHKHMTAACNVMHLYTPHRLWTVENAPVRRDATTYIYLSGGRALVVSDNLETDEHSHHALQITINLEPQPFLMRHAGGEEALNSAVIRSNWMHQVVSCNWWRAVMFIDPQTQFGHQIHERYSKRGGVVALDPDDFDFCQQCLSGFAGQAQSIEIASQALDRIVERLAGPIGAGDDLNPRVKQALRVIHETQGRQLTLEYIARHVFLSESRISHLFKHDVGIPIQRYLLWYKLAQAAFNIGRGLSLTDAAEEAGFADSAHFSRSFRVMFGVTPSQILKRSRHVQVISDLR